MKPPGRPLTILPGGRRATGDPGLVLLEGEDPKTATVVAANFSTDVFRDNVVVAYPDGTRDLVHDRAVRRGQRTPPRCTSERATEGARRRAGAHGRPLSPGGTVRHLHGIQCSRREPDDGG